MNVHSIILLLKQKEVSWRIQDVSIVISNRKVRIGHLEHYEEKNEKHFIFLFKRKNLEPGEGLTKEKLTLLVSIII